MRKYKREQYNVVRLSLLEVTCNKCGKALKTNFEDEITINGKFLEVRFSPGYDSKNKNKEWHFDLCEHCLIELVNSFEVPIPRSDINQPK